MFKCSCVSLIIGMIATLMPGCAATVPVHADSVAFLASSTWKPEPLGHESRKLQFTLASNEKDVDNAMLIVWNFPTMRDPGDGSVIRMNMDRWTDSFTQDDGTPSADVARITECSINGLAVHLIDIRGRYVAETSPGSGVHVDRPGYRMLGAYMVAPQGDYIVKLWGPASVVARHEGEFHRFVRSAHLDDPAAPGDAQPGHAPQAVKKAETAKQKSIEKSTRPRVESSQRPTANG